MNMMWVPILDLELSVKAHRQSHYRPRLFSAVLFRGILSA